MRMGFIEGLQVRSKETDPLKRWVRPLHHYFPCCHLILSGSAPWWLLESDITLTNSCSTWCRSEASSGKDEPAHPDREVWMERGCCLPERQGSEWRAERTSMSWTRRTNGLCRLGACVLEDHRVSSQARKIQRWDNCIVLDLYHIPWKYLHMATVSYISVLLQEKC